VKKTNIKELFTVLLPALLVTLLLSGIFIFAACSRGGNNSDGNTNVRSVEIVSEDAESVKIGKKEHFAFEEYAEFEVILRDAANNEITVDDPQNIVWTLDGADTDNFYFLDSSSLSSSTGAYVTVQFDFTAPYDTEAELKVSYKGLSKKVNLTVDDIDI
jgi:ABC-type Fe3+-hydroxamate transport system substrate-binding protein